MMVRRFLDWARHASATERAAATAALAQAYLGAELAADDFREAEAVLTVLADDPSPLVRRALAEAFAPAAEAPAHIVLALANDQGDIASLVLARSPLLGEADLVDCVAVGDALAQTAVALRAWLPDTVAAALAEIGHADALLALLRNRSAVMPPLAFRRIVERFPDHGELREALLGRQDLPVEVRQSIVVAVSNLLGAFVAERGWMRPERSSRVLDEARQAATLALDGAETDAAALVRHLRASGQLTAGFVLRALLSGRPWLFCQALADLAGLPAERVAGIIDDGRLHAFRALYRKAGMPPSLAAGFEAAIRVLQEGGIDVEDSDARLSRPMIERVLARLEAPGVSNDRLVALLRRFEAEAAREEARGLVAALTLAPPAVNDALRVLLLPEVIDLDVLPLFDDPFALPGLPLIEESSQVAGVPQAA